MDYKAFVSKHIKSPQLAHLQQKDKMRYVAALWRKSGHSKSAAPTKKGKKTTRGAGLFGDIGDAADSVGSLFGLGLPKKGKGRRARGGYINTDGYKSDSVSDEEGAGLFGDIGSAADSIGSLFGLGLKAKRKARKPRGGQVVGAGMLDDLLGVFGGDVAAGSMHKPRRRRRGGALVAGALDDDSI